MALLIYAVTLFVSAFLLFLVQPVIGQKILPKLGGTPSVWNTCVVFFQLALLVGYAYTHFATKLPVRRQILIHCALLFVPFLILLPGWHPFNVLSFKPITGGNPIVETLVLLATIVGIPFFVVSTTAPLLQKWFGSTGHPAAKDPYFLYGASNFGSMLALLAYPVAFEPLLGLEAQSWFYTLGYMVLVGMVITCALVVFASPPSVQLPGKKLVEEPEHVPALQPEPPPVTDIAAGPPPGNGESGLSSSTGVTTEPRPQAPRPALSTNIKKGGKKAKMRDLAKGPAPSVTPSAAAAMATPSIAKPGAADVDEITWGRRLRWIGLAAVPSSLMLGVTTYMSTDISAIPLFWVVPLALYLLSFIFVFMRWPINWLEQAHEFVLYTQPVMLVLLALFMTVPSAVGVVYMIFAMLLAFFLTALALHGEMAKDRPSTKHLTEFYLLMSVGGAIGGLFNGIIAPYIFADFGVVEFGLAIVLAGLFRPTMRDAGWTETALGGMGETHDTGKHHPGKGGRRITKGGSEKSGMTMLLDIAYPLAVLIGLAILLYTVYPNTNAKIFYVCIVPAICTALFFARPIRFGLALGAFMILTGHFLHGGGDIAFQTRSYFGVLRVREYADGNRSERSFGMPYTNLMHGTTDHGMCLQNDHTRVATTYYHRQGPVGICMERFNWFPKDYDTNSFWADARMPASLIGLGAPALGINLPVQQLVGVWSEPPYAVIGMGTATMASYCRPYQTCHFYEIDEQIRLLSLRNPGRKPYFTYVENALNRKGNVQILMGDARLRMEMPWVPTDPDVKDLPPWEISSKHFDKRGGPENFYHLMVVDAFSSDAIPRHLITKESMEMYLRHLAVGRWGPWIEVDPKSPNYDIHGNSLDTSPTKEPIWETKVDGDKTKKRLWYPGGVLCVHTSNRHLELVPVVADTASKVVWYDPNDVDSQGNMAKHVGLVARVGHDAAPGAQYLGYKEDVGHYNSEWVILARDEKDLKHLVPPSKYNEWMAKARELPKNRGRGDLDDPYWKSQSPTGSGQYVWTDDHTNLMAVFRWPWSRGH